MRSIFLIFSIFLSWSMLIAQEEINREFLAHVTQEASTRDWGKFNFYRPTSFNAKATVLTNALTVTALPRFEIGTSPAYFFEKEHQFNIVTKVNFVRSKRWDWAFGLNVMQFKFEDDATPRNKYEYTQANISLGFNYYSPVWGLDFSSYINSVGGTVTGDSLSVPESKNKFEWGADVSKVFSRRYFVTVGLGQLRDTGYTPFEEVEWNYGLSAGLKIPGAIFSRPSAGFLYCPENGSWGFLASTTFF